MLRYVQENPHRRSCRDGGQRPRTRRSMARCGSRPVMSCQRREAAGWRPGPGADRTGTVGEPREVKIADGRPKPGTGGISRAAAPAGRRPSRPARRRRSAPTAATSPSRARTRSATASASTMVSRSPLTIPTGQLMWSTARTASRPHSRRAAGGSTPTAAAPASQRLPSCVPVRPNAPSLADTERTYSSRYETVTGCSISPCRQAGRSGPPAARSSRR